MKGAFSLLGIVLSVGISLLSQGRSLHYRVLPPVSQGNLTVFPVSSNTSFDTGSFLTLEEGIRSGEVIVTETSQVTGLVRPRQNREPGFWTERTHRQRDADVNELSLINNSKRPLLLLAGEIVTGGKQDRVVSKDRIIPSHSEPVALGVFCVEPHRWTETSAHFAAPQALMAQPSVRSRAMADKSQQQVWNEVARTRIGIAQTLSPAAIDAQSSSYANAMASRSVQLRIDSVAKPLEQSYETLIQKLRAEKAVGAVVALNGEIIWADVFASPDLLNRFWPKLIRSYAAESFTSQHSRGFKGAASEQDAQAFLDQLGATHESIDSEPGLYRNTEITGDDYNAFILTALLPGTGFDVHLAKMRR